MTTPRQETIERERHKLFVTDAELIRRAGLPERVARKMLKDMDADPSKGFPPKQQELGNRRYWPAVQAWLAEPPTPEPTPEEKEADADRMGHVYFLADTKAVKIGFSAGIKKRLSTIRTNHYEKLELIAVIQRVPKRLEAALHKKFAAHRIHRRKEWFHRVPEIEEYATDHLRHRHWHKELE